MNLRGISNYFRKTPPILPKYIVSRDGVNELTLPIDCSSTVAELRTLLAQRISNLSENEQFIHSNGVPIHIFDEQNTIVSEILLKNSNIICLKSKLTTNSIPNMIVHKSVYCNEESLMKTREIAQTALQTNPMIRIIEDSETKSVPLTELLSETSLMIQNESMSTNDMKLTISSLYNNKHVEHLLISSDCRDIVDILVDILQVNKTLTWLLFEGYVNNAECTAIARALRNNHYLEMLNIRSSKITSIGCQAIGEMLKLNTTLRSLDICRNKLNDDGIQIICEALMVNQTLNRLDIYQTNMSSKGVQYVARMLQMNHGLTEIDIGDNKISDNDITIIANVLKSNSTLTTLAVKCSEITEKGALELVKMLKINKTLTTVKLQFSEIPDDVAKRIHQQAPQLKITATVFDKCSIL